MCQEQFAGAHPSLRARVFACLVFAQVVGCGTSPSPGPGTGKFPSSGSAGTTGMIGATAGTTPTAASGGTGAAPGGVAGTPSGVAGTSVSSGSSGTAASAAGRGGASAAGGAGAVAGAPAAGGGAGGASANPPSGDHAYLDPGKADWAKVAEADVPSVCKLDVAKLKAAETAATYPWMIVRYGKYCWGHNADTFAPAEAYSTTKTLGALVTGMASYQTRMLAKSGPMTGPLSDEDPVTQWIPSPSYNKMAKVAHVLGMVAHDADLSWGKKSFAYDTVGTTEINTLGTMITAAIKQDSARLGTTVAAFTQKFLYEPLGMKNSQWAGAVFAYTWTVDLKDMARVGVLINNYGMWAGERLVDEQWIYRQTHPSFEDANTGFGYLTWLNSSSNWQSIDGVKKQEAGTPGTCAPICLHKSYPHGVSEAKDCNYMAPKTCDQKYDVGVWNAEGLGGQLIQGHRGLDLVIVARNAQPGGTGPGTAKQVWDAVKGAVIAGDPMYKGDEAMFCKDYGSNNYAPDLK
jgi:hypothetical protein